MCYLIGPLPQSSKIGIIISIFLIREQNYTGPLEDLALVTMDG